MKQCSRKLSKNLRKKKLVITCCVNEAITKIRKETYSKS